MKKLILVMTVIASAFVANAASYTWNWSWKASGLYAYDGTSTYSGVVSLYAVGLGLDGADLLVSQYDTSNVAGGAVAGKIDNSLDAAQFTTTTATEDAPTYSFYLTYIDSSMEFTSTTVETSAIAGNEGATVNFKNLTSQTQAQGNWTATGNVPEPTSGLLLLCGLAGLALRRKKA